MLRMFRELKGSYRYIVLIFALLFGQAFCDLALPSYTSDIINVGVQQGGIPDSVPDQIRESSMDQLFLFMDSDQQQEVKEYYTLKDGVYTHKKLKEEERDSLNTIFGKSMLAVSSLQQPDTQNALAEKMQLPNGADVPETIAQLPDEARRQIMEQMTEKLDAGTLEEIRNQGLELLGVVPHDDQVYQYDCNGKPIIQLPKDSPVRSALGEIVKKLGL